MTPSGRVFLCAACMIAAVTQITGAAEPNESSKRILTLRPTPASGLRMDINDDFGHVVPPFEKEPAYEGKLIIRGWIPTVPPTPMIRNITDGQLYVKADHDQDFTRGTPATYAVQCRDGAHFYFEGMKVFARQGSLAIPYTADLYTYRRGLLGWFYVRSGWTARLDEGDTQWSFTVVDNLDGRIDGQDRLILVRVAPVDSPRARHECPVPQELALDGRTFRLDFQYKEAETGIVLEAGLTDLQPAMGELQIDANSCESLVLRDNRRIALLSSPTGVLSVPAGRYRVENCVLRREPNQWLGPVFSESDQEVQVESGRTASLCLGLPLTNTIAVTRDRNLLAFKYRLVGAGGELYDYDNPVHPPGFYICKGPVKIGRGSFGFG